MGYRASVSFDCADIGKRVSVRYLLPDGSATDVVGIMEHCDDGSIAVRNRRSEVVRVHRGDIVAGKLVSSPPWEDEDPWQTPGGGKPAPG